MSAVRKGYSSPEAEALAAQFFGRQIPEDKQLVLAVATLVACALPLMLGLRLWDRIPEIIPTGWHDFAGNDDPLPRTMAVLWLPAFFTLLNVIAHVQLHLFQKRDRLPPGVIRLFGRWGVPILSLLMCGTVQLHACGLRVLTPSLAGPVVAGFALVFWGSAVFGRSKPVSCLMMAAGLAVAACAVLFAPLA